MNKTKRSRAMGRMLLVVALLTFGTVASLEPAKATEYSCQREGCANHAACWGDLYSSQGCENLCWANDNGHITPMGSAFCGDRQIE
jgi:hypothetical protein